MIDQHLIKKNSQQLLASIVNRQATSLSDLYQLHDVLDQTILDKLLEYLQIVDDSKWVPVEWQEDKPRKKISWDFDTVIEELHEIFDSTTETINKIFPEVDKKFWGVSLWKDEENYSIGWHTDNPDIDTAIQIYLYTPSGLGTVFNDKEPSVLIPSIPNSGYLAVHSGNKKIAHRSESTVPPGVTRYSLYAVWSRFPKHHTDPQ